MTGAAQWSAGHHDALATRRVRWGHGSVNALRSELHELERDRVFVVTTQSLEHAVATTVEAALGDASVGRFTRMPAHVPAPAVAEGVAAVRATAPDAIVGVGGGSVLDAVKAIVSTVRSQDGWHIGNIAIPTTLSGSEYAHFYGVTEGDFKQSYMDPASVPELVLLDPALTELTPLGLWNGSAFKALDHAVETLYAPGERPVADPLALLGIREMAATLEASNLPGRSDARLQCQIAAWHCYFAPANATLGVSHRIGHVLGGTYGVPHAATSSITLPAVLRATEGLRPPLDAAIAEALSPAGQPAGSSAGAAQLLTSLASRLGLPTTLADIGVDRGALRRIGELLRTHYPQSIGALGSDAETRLDTLLDAMAR